MSVRCVRCCVLRMVVLSSYALLVQLFAAYSYQHRGTLFEDSVQRSWTATFFRIFVFFLYPEKYGGSKNVLKSTIGLVDHIKKK